MKVMVVGGGGREHALSWLFNKDPEVKKIYCAPGNAGTEMLEKCENVDIGPTNVNVLADYANENKIDLTVVGPEGPLVEGEGIVNVFQNRGLMIFGPTKEAARIESSKAFADELSFGHGIPSPRSASFHTYGGAINYIEEFWRDDFKIVPKGDGLAGGKAAIVCDTKKQAKQAIKHIMKLKEYGSAGNIIVLQERLYGEELSEIGISDGAYYMGFATSQDHKPILDGDRGVNTGGMGAYSPAPVARGYENEIKNLMTVAISAMYDEGFPYVGALYGGLMITREGPKKMEFNARFGDPEKQPVAMRMKSPFTQYLVATMEGNLRKMKPPEWDPRPAVCVVVASSGYPDSYEKGKLITGLDEISNMEDVYVFHAGTKKENGNIYTSGGRVLGVTALGNYENDFEGAKERAYEAVKMIRFDGGIEDLYFRKDISDKALKHI
jgi:phosphoribosylamine--glycine ligase